MASADKFAGGDPVDGRTAARTGPVLIPKNEDVKSSTGETDPSLTRDNREVDNEASKTNGDGLAAPGGGGGGGSVPSSLDEDWVNLSLSPNHPLHQQSGNHPLENSGD